MNKVIIINPCYDKIYFFIHSHIEYRNNDVLNFKLFPLEREYKAIGVDGYISFSL